MRLLPLLALAFTLALPVRAADEFDDYDYDSDGSSPMNVTDGPGSGGPTPADAPIDDYVPFLALAGGFYAWRRLRRPPAPTT
ncbi:MAG TPA: hypothetical protein VEI97_11185 [bacterium]|nr:hypothetical protein [bacterium]